MKMVLFEKIGSIWAIGVAFAQKVVLFGQKVVVFGQNGNIWEIGSIWVRWFYFGKRRLYLGKR